MSKSDRYGNQDDVAAFIALLRGDEELPSGTDETGPSKAAEVPREVIVHAFEGGHPRDDREKMRQALAKPKKLAGPATRDEIDFLFAQAFAQSPWLQEPLEWLWQQSLGALEDEGAFQLPPILLVGPQGCGKTHLAQLIADLAGVPYTRLDCSTLNSAFQIGGMDAGWRSSHPGVAVQYLHDAGVANPFILLDEIEKSPRSAAGGDPRTALLPLLQQQTSAKYRCPYLQAPIDLSRVSWIMLANSVDGLPAPLLDRVMVFHVDYPRGDHLRDLIERRLDGLTVSSVVIDELMVRMDQGRLTLRKIDRLAEVFRNFERRPRLN